MSRAMMIDPQPEEENVDAIEQTKYNQKQKKRFNKKLSNLKNLNQVYQRSTKVSL